MTQYLRKIKEYIFYDTYGYIATASFLICAVTGILIAIPFDIANPYDSVSIMLITDPASSFMRNMHYWSAQLFLIFSIIHIWDHFNKNTDSKIKRGVWLRLTISILFIFYAMLSGFILKADADALQAKRILSSLINLIPFFGNTLSVTFLGTENNFQILYIQHIATATIFLAVIIFEHAKTIWTRLSTAFYTLVIVFILSYFITPALHNNLNPIIKGPWYFLGLQEILHWVDYPEVVVGFVLLFFVVIYLLPRFNIKYNLLTKKSIIYIFIAYFFLTLFAYFFRGENWEFHLPWNNPYFQSTNIVPFDFTLEGSDSLLAADIPEILNRREGCLYCHSGVKGFSASHNPEAIGCFSCHLGNPFTVNKSEAHIGIVLHAGNLETAGTTCGAAECHPGIPYRVNNSLMNTLSGMISVNKYAFEEIDKPAGLFDVKLLKDSPADSHLRNLCVSCHTGNEKELGPITETTRGGGCSSCHLNYGNEAAKEFAGTYAKDNIVKMSFHPSLDLNISNDHCFGCHSRSGRISTNYEGWHETQLEPREIESDSSYRVLEDGRVFKYVEADVHYKAGMQCIDCHTSYEVMGDGNKYQHKEEQLIVECADCHNNSLKYISSDSIDNESKKIAQLRKTDEKGRKYLAANRTGQPLLNTRLENGKAVLDLKLSQKTLNLNPPVSVCQEGKGHERLSCTTCHSSWAPQCVGCHTEYNADEEGFDLLLNKTKKGVWEEHVGEYLAEAPVLGISFTSETDGSYKETVNTFVPGMVMTLNKNMSGEKQNDNDIFKRLYAPSFPHTISKKARDCKSCHNNPLAIGYGRGVLTYNGHNNRKWEFAPKYQMNKNDGLPEDAWIGFLSEPESSFATREYVRPFSLKEQKKILTVGACLTCHTENSRFLRNSVGNFEKLLSEISTKCLLPVW